MLLLGVASAKAQTAVKLVGNTGQATSGSTFFEQPTSTSHLSFTTGSNAADYVLTRVDLEVQSLGAGTDRSVSVHENSSGSPSTSLGTLTNPSSCPSSWAMAQFTASGDGIALAASTTYFVKATGINAGVRVTDTDAEDTGASAGWSIANSSVLTGNNYTDVPKMAIHGYANSAPTVANPILDQRTLAGVAFNHTFPADTFNDADTGDTLTYTATKSEDSALPSRLTFPHQRQGLTRFDRPCRQAKYEKVVSDRSRQRVGTTMSDQAQICGIKRVLLTLRRSRAPTSLSFRQFSAYLLRCTLRFVAAG